MELARSLDPRQIPPLRRGPLCQRIKEPRTPWRNHVGIAMRLMLCLLVLAGMVWAGL